MISAAESALPALNGMVSSQAGSAAVLAVKKGLGFRDSEPSAQAYEEAVLSCELGQQHLASLGLLATVQHGSIADLSRA